jgi:hypothetical protein
MGFWQIYFALYGADGAAAPTVTVNDGWIAESRSRVMIPESRERVWIAKGKSS